MFFKNNIIILFTLLHVGVFNSIIGTRNYEVVIIGIKLQKSFNFLDKEIYKILIFVLVFICK